MLRRALSYGLKPLFRNHIYTLRHGLAQGYKIKGGLGFLKPYREPTAEERFLMNLQLSGNTVYDIGGYVGITAMFFSRAVGETGRVITFEPNPTNAAAIRQNLALNHLRNVEVIESGLGAAPETKTLVYDPNDTAAGSMNQQIQARLLATQHRQIDITVQALDEYVAAQHLAAPDLVKIDVEGMEYDVLRGMQKMLRAPKPALFIELHGDGEQQKRANVQNVFTLLQACHYMIHHVETDQTITSTDLHKIQEGHFYCT
ncbi:MAG: hypothetical protein ALAOOOJD_00967 [bacterium]|nr:hypothetical protein [bacterium]